MLTEHLQHNYHHTNLYEQTGITFVGLTPGEFEEVVREYVERLDGSWLDTLDDEKRQQKYWQKFKEWSKFSEYHEWIHPEARLGTHYLQKMGGSFLA